MPHNIALNLIINLTHTIAGDRKESATNMNNPIDM